MPAETSECEMCGALRTSGFHFGQFFNTTLKNCYETITKCNEVCSLVQNEVTLSDSSGQVLYCKVRFL